MKNRFYEVRKNSGLTQEKFAEKLGLTRNYISLIERGDRIPGDRTISDVCREFGVNETWLRTGEGEMLLPKSREEELEQFFDSMLRVDDSNLRRRWCKVLCRLSDEQLQKLAEIGEALHTEWKNTESEMEDG